MGYTTKKGHKLINEKMDFAEIDIRKMVFNC
jgi:hypothetical protein